MANQPKSVSRTLYLDTSSAQSALDKVGRKIADFDRKLAENGKLSKKEQREMAKAIEERGRIEQQIANKVGPTYRQQSQYVRQLTNEMKNLAVGTAEFGKKMQELQKAQQVLRGIKDRMGEVDKASQGMNGGLTKMGVFMASFAANLATKAISAIADFGRAAFETGQRFEKLRAVLSNTFGSKVLSELAFNELAEFASKTPFALEELTASFLKMVNRGFRPTMDEMRKLGDLAAAMGKDFDQLVEALLDAQVGEFERLKEFGIRASKANGEVTISFKGQTKVVKDNEQAIRDAIIALGDLEGVAGGMAVQANTTSGRISNLGDAFDQLASTVFTIFQPAINWVIDKLSATVKLATDAAKAVAAVFSSGGIEGAKAKQQWDVFIQGKIDDFKKLTKAQQDAFISQLKSKVASNPQELAQARFSLKPDQFDRLKQQQGAEARLLEALLNLDNGTTNPATKTETGASKKIKEIKKEATEAEKALQALMNRLQDLGRATVRAGMVPDRNAIVDPKTQLPTFTGNGAGADAAAEASAAATIMKLSAKGAKERRQAMLAELEAERQAKIAASRGTAAEMQAINMEYAEGAKRIWQNYSSEVAEIVSFGLQQLQAGLQVLTQFNDARTAIENAALQRELEANKLKAKSYEAQLQKKVITEGQYRKKMAELEAAADARSRELQKKQWERAKKLQIAQAIVNGALAITSTLAARPGPTDIISLGVFRAVSIAAAVAATAAQIAVISSQKPTFARGGRLSGPSHSHGGMPVIDPRTGAKQAEVEGGEVILSKQTVRNNADIIAPLLHASMHQGGRRISHPWEQRPYRAMQYNRLAAATGIRKFASGGVFTPNNAADAGNEGLRDVLLGLQDLLANGIPAYIRYNQLTNADAFKERQRQEAALRA